MSAPQEWRVEVVIRVDPAEAEGDEVDLVADRIHEAFERSAPLGGWGLAGVSVDVKAPEPVRPARITPDRAALAARTAAGVARILHRTGETRVAAQALRWYLHTPRHP